MKLDTAAIWFAAVLLAFAPLRAKGAEPTTRPTTRPFDLRSDDAGRLMFTPRLAGKVLLGEGRCWNCQDGEPVALDCYSPRGNYWSGHVSVRLNGDVLTLWGGREQYLDWAVREFTLQQGPEGVTATFIVRTPIGQPDVTYRVTERHTALLMLRCPEVAWMLNECLRAVGAEEYDPGPFVRAQLAGDVRVTDEVAERVGVLIELSDAAEWRTRERSIAALNGMGRDGAAALLLLDRRGLTAGEQVAVERVLGAWPVVGSPNQFRDRAPERPGDGFEGR